MNKHTKLALFVAPFLAVVGWIGSDIWLQSQAMKKRFYTMEPEAGYCDLMAKNCILRAGDFKLSLYQEGPLTTLNSTYPLDTATLFLVDQNDQPTVYRMGMKDSPYYWYQQTTMAELNREAGSKQKLRLIVTVKGGQYIAEFYSTTLGTEIT